MEFRGIFIRSSVKPKKEIKINFKILIHAQKKSHN